MELTFLTVDDVIFIQSEILSSAPITDIGKLESAIKRAEQYHYYESVNDIVELTAIYIIGIAKAHAFPDGNKRTSFLSATYFLDMNSYALEENSELPDIIEQAASGAIDRHRLTELLRPYTVSTEQLKHVQENEDYEVFDSADYIDNPVALARIQAGITQEELAKLMSLTQAYVSKIENQEKVTAKMLKKVQLALDKEDKQ